MPPGAAARRHIMIGDAEGQLRLGDGTAARLHLTEGVERALVDVMAIDPEQRGAVLAARDLVRRPEPIDQGRGLAHRGSVCRSASDGLVEGRQYCMLKNTK